MNKSIPVSAKKRRGRPAGQKYPVILQLRLSENQAAEFDAWRERHFEHPSRSEAIRQLIAEALKRKRS